MWRVGCAAAVLMLLAMSAAEAQPWGPPYGRSNGGYFSFWGGGWNDYPERRRGPVFQSGGERPDITPIPPKTVNFPSQYPVGSVVIDTKGRQLLLVTSATEALHYPISVGREGFTWSGTEVVSRKQPWPDWHPPEEMRARDRRLPEKMSGGVKNPLGAMAIYLGSSLYRIHGTNDASSIGRAASSGCFRMLNGQVMDLAGRVEVGTTVTVVRRLPPELEKIVAEQVTPPKAELPKKRTSAGTSTRG